MKIVFKNEKLTIDEVISGEFQEYILMDHELPVVNFVKKWFSKDDFIEFVTSGSTGTPKVISLTKHQMIQSANSTMKFIDQENHIKQCILCISPNYIGGSMLIVRAILKNLDLVVLKPNAIPEISRFNDALISMVPLQIIQTMDNHKSSLDKVHTLLIGGAELPDPYIKLLKTRKVNAYATYGMTETASHIALRHVSSSVPYFQVLEGIDLSTDERSCLKISGQVTNNQWIQTNDIVNLIDDKTFEWVGRADLVINSGGHKVSPEQVEKSIEKHIPNPVLIVSEKDNVLGQRVIMLIEGQPFEIPNKVFHDIHEFSRPKRVHFVNHFIYTASGKIDRIKTVQKYLK